MKTRTLLLFGLGLLAGAAQAQDARAVIQTVAKAMGTEKVNTLEYSGEKCEGLAPAIAGEPFTVCTRFAIIGQSWIGTGSPLLGGSSSWPINQFNEYRRFIDYSAKAARREVAVVRGSGTVALGGNDVPREGEHRLIEYVNGNYTWDQRDNAPVAVFGHDGPWHFASAPAFRQLEIWLTPHGFVKAALAAEDVTTFPRTEFLDDGTPRELQAVSFTQGKYRLTGYINKQNLVEAVMTHLPEAVMGDMLQEYVYRGYADHDGVMFPTQIHTHTGDRFLGGASNAFNLSVTQVKVNAPGPGLAVPEAVRRATAPTVRVETQQLANGVWLLGGAAISSVVVEFKDWVAVVEAPLNEARSLAVMAEVKRLVPGKPIRYVVNTHHHSDSAGGLRAYVANGATIITDELNREYYSDILLSRWPRTLEPDRMSLQPVRTIYEGSILLETVSSETIYVAPWRRTMLQTYVLTDRSRTMEIYPVRPLDHAGTMLMVYLPGERILINSDIYSPRGSRTMTKDLRQFRSVIESLGLAVDRHVSLEGGVGDHSTFQQLFTPQQ